VEFVKPIVQTKTDIPPLTTLDIMKEQNKQNKQRTQHLNILKEMCDYIKEEIELQENKKLSSIKKLSITPEQYNELIITYLVVDLFSETPNWKYNIGLECKYTNPGLSTFSKEYISVIKRHLHIPRLSIKKIERSGIKLGKLVKGYRNFGNKKKEKLTMSWDDFKNLMKKIGDIY
tara:strand:- start:6044 stop:6568 length:525 start_codon:yes stop_codon:yes gene_type:complete